jgi:drug/metabolite transporter (DMT)-like permease
MMSSAKPLSARDGSLLVLLAVIWGATFFFAEIALRELTPLWLTCLRVAIAASFLGCLMLLGGARLPLRPDILLGLLVMGLLNNVVPFSLIFWSQTAIDSSLAAILNATTPFWAVLIAHVVTRDERATVGRVAGCAIGFAGVAVMLGPAALSGVGSAVLPQLAVLLATLSYAAAGLFGRRFRGLPPVGVAAGQLVASALVMLVLVLATQPMAPLAALSGATWAAVLALAVVGTGIAYVLYFRLLASAGATNLLLVTLLIPITAAALGAVLLGERLALGQISGMMLILTGLAVIDGRPLAHLRRRKLVEVS